MNLSVNIDFSDDFHRFVEEIPYLNRPLYTYGQALVCDDDLQSRTAPRVGSRVFYVMLLPQYTDYLSELTIQTCSTTEHYKGSIFVKPAFPVFIKPLQWLLGIVDQLLRQFDVHFAHCSFKDVFSITSVNAIFSEWFAQIYGVGSFV